jgi:hypothetical protein
MTLSTVQAPSSLGFLLFMACHTLFVSPILTFGFFMYSITYGCLLPMLFLPPTPPHQKKKKGLVATFMAETSLASDFSNLFVLTGSKD